MSSKSNDGGKKVTRGRFLNFLGKIGIVLAATGLPVFAARNKESEVVMRDTGNDAIEHEVTAKRSILRRPLIKGKDLSRTALESELSTKNLEDIRDVITGRFFGRAIERTFKDGDINFINWSLGSDGSDSGCFLYANFHQCLNPMGEGVNNCSLVLTATEDPDMSILDVSASIYNRRLGDLKTGSENIGYIPDGCLDCNWQKCMYKPGLDFRDFVSYPSDVFVREITGILNTTDVSEIRRALKNVIFSDDMLNLCLNHFVEAAHERIIESEIELRS